MSPGLVKAILLPLKILLLLLTAAGGLWLGQLSFDKIREVRQLERVPRTEAGAALPGLINLRGRVAMGENPMQSAYFKVPCVYYRFVEDVESKDSKGHTSWTTVQDIQAYRDFILQDDSGQVEVLPTNEVTFSVPAIQERRVGKRRYREWRLQPGDEVFVFGYAMKGRDGIQVRFDRLGAYTRLISKYAEKEERGDWALGSLLASWGGLALLAFSVWILAWTFGIHRLLIYLGILTVLITAFLAWFGLGMMKSDLRDGYERLESVSQGADEEIGRVLTAEGIDWPGLGTPLSFESRSLQRLDPKVRHRLRRMRVDVALSLALFDRQREAFPERWLAPLWGIGKAEQIPLPAEDREFFETELAKFEGTRIEGSWVLIVALLAAVISLGFSWLGFRQVRFKRWIENVPTSKSKGVVYGLTELGGVVGLPGGRAPLRGPISNEPCVLYRYLVQERRGRGKNSRWVTIEKKERDLLFLAKDEEGEITINPEGAEILSRHKSKRREGRRRYTETRLEVGDPLYALGQAGIEPIEGTSLQLMQPEPGMPWLLSNFSEREVMLIKARRGMLWLNLAFILLLLAALLLFGKAGALEATDYLMAALIAPLYMAAIVLILHYNDLVFLRERVDRAWANIQVSLQKRSDLIPNLEKVAKQYLTHEKDLHTALAQMREKYSGGALPLVGAAAEFLQAEHLVGEKFMGLREAYPELMGQQLVGRVMTGLIDNENEVALMRAGFNDAVENYNSRIQSFPDIVFSKAFDFVKRDFLQYDATLHRPTISM